MAAVVPASWAEVLEVAGLSVNVRAVLTDVARENLTFADMEEWHDVEVDEDETVSREQQTFDGKVTQKLGDPMLDQDLAAVKASRGVKVTNAVTPEYEEYEDDQEHQKRMPDTDNFDPETYD
jgi:hypothetical protein